MPVVELEDRGPVRIVWMNRPDRRNALSGELIEALHDALDAAETDDAVRAIVLGGRGKVFCAGGDLAGGFGAGAEGIVAGEAARARYGALLAKIPKLTKPVIAAVDGDAMGGGIGLVAGCDLAVVAADARLGTPEVKVGLWPFVITAALQRNVPRKPLLQMMLTGARVSADDAVELGLANEVVEEGGALAAAVALAERIAGMSRAVVSLGKASFELASELPYEAALQVLNHRLTVGLLTEDAGEGIAAFLARRPPEWKDR